MADMVNNNQNGNMRPQSSNRGSIRPNPNMAGDIRRPKPNTVDRPNARDILIKNEDTRVAEDTIDFGGTSTEVNAPKEVSKKNKKSDTEKIQENKKFVLYAIIDRPIDGLLNYFRDYGVNVSKIFNSIKDARDALLMQIEPSKIMIIDTGTGRFANMAARKDLIDLMGISDEENQTLVFYSDSVIKTEVEYTKEVKDKQIKWVKYKSTAGVVAYMLQNMPGNEYVNDGGYKPAAEPVKSNQHMGYKDNSFTKSSLGMVQINTSDIASMHDCDTAPYSLLDAYDVYIK